MTTPTQNPYQSSKAPDTTNERRPRFAALWIFACALVILAIVGLGTYTYKLQQAAVRAEMESLRAAEAAVQAQRQAREMIQRTETTNAE